MNSIRIGVLGIGGVGGYFGGLLASAYKNNEHISVSFIARGNTAEILREKGLRLITDDHEQVISPHVVTNGTNQPPFHYLICCVKSYDLEPSLTELGPAIDSSTVILPLLNGVDATDRIQKLYPDNLVAEGCVYLVSTIQEPGVIRKTGKIESLFLGSSRADIQPLVELDAILRNADIASQVSDTIQTVIWEKFIFISCVASITSYLDQSIGPILEHSEHKKILLALVREVVEVATNLNIPLPGSIYERTLEKIDRLAPEATSSMHRDFRKGGKTELQSLTAYVAEMGDQVNVETPTFDMVLSELQKRSS